MFALVQDDEFKEKMRVVKALYTSRHYTQCAKFGARVLSEVDDETHPIHTAYLNFYTALSHDTLAREATLKNRYAELSAAEKHYGDAIGALTSPSIAISNDEQLSSPASATSNDERRWNRRSSNTWSFDSTTTHRSSTSSATSYSQDEDVGLGLTLKDYAFPTPPARDLGGNLTVIAKHQSTHYYDDTSVLSPLPISTFPATLLPCTPQNVNIRFPPDTAAFVSMLDGHLASVREMRGMTSVGGGARFTFSTPKTSPVKASFRESRKSQVCGGEGEVDGVRQKRKLLQSRPRFDPEAVRKLCRDALAELP
ncbi:hypothetical protein EJ02DRAFT_500158 [Clathrospora elynae]|uniref:Uncharacterized protein n=1 Tax=Clathrospora elynae TaxID=706981 RepID=A0A6A5T035_9PLEO|nr:hypothetical protein EJ02DRAFT_500158 [Clathrospora elynae]